MSLRRATRLIFVRSSRQISCPLLCTRLLSSSPRRLQSIPGLPQQADEDDAANNKNNGWRGTLFKMFESAATTFVSLAVLGAAGYSYHRYYKSLVLRKMDLAFQPGDPILELASPSALTPLDIHPSSTHSHSDDSETFVVRPEQDVIDQIMAGSTLGRYWLLIGEKGTGKSSMIIEGMRKVNAANISMFDAHSDLEIFRVRLGKALNYEFHEDYIGSLFSVRGPRDTTALLDIERAFNKLEKIALDRRRQRRNPLILVVNCLHLIRDDEDGRDLLELLQQRAEQWAASNLVTMVLNSDEYWVYERLKQNATRMEILPVRDLTKPYAIAALHACRQHYFPTETIDPSSPLLTEIYDAVGGRINYISRVTKARDMLAKARQIRDAEKTWFLNRCGILGETMDDDVMDQQKFASCAMVLAKALVDAEKDANLYSDKHGHVLPEIPLHKARQIMTRADFIQMYDHDNLFTIDSNSMVRADSVPMMNAFREICAEEGFAEHLQQTLDRIAQIESIGRTREVTLKDLWIEQQGEQRGRYEFVMKDAKGRDTGKIEFRVKPDDESKD